jgi:hypothetical protein
MPAGIKRTIFKEACMNRKKITIKIAAILCAAVFALVGCQQPVETTNGSRDSIDEKDSLLLEVWDSSNPPQFLGYDTGLAQYSLNSSGNIYNSDTPYNSRPPIIILTSKGYCVELKYYYYVLNFTTGTSIEKIAYGRTARRSYDLDIDDTWIYWHNIMKNTGWGSAVFFEKTTTPTANDTPYALGGYSNIHTNIVNSNIVNSNIVNDVLFNPHNGGTYYTKVNYSWDDSAYKKITIQANHKFYDNTGTLRSWNDDVGLGEFSWEKTSESIGYSLNFIPLKRIGGYAELGLPNPATVTAPLVFKVR